MAQEFGKSSTYMRLHLSRHCLRFDLCYLFEPEEQIPDPDPVSATEAKQLSEGGKPTL
jgi:hypothetical protein